MYILTSVVGTNYAVYDDSDNSVEWINTGMIKKLLSNGIVITGINVTNNEVKPQIINLSYKDLNWNKGKNIFQTAEAVRTDSKGNISFKSGDKKYKAKMMIREDGSALLMLTNGVKTILPSEVMGYLRTRV